MPSMDEEDDLRRFLIRGTGSQLADNKSLKDMLDDMEGSGFATGTDSLKVLSDVLDLIRTELTFQHQADAVLDQDNPISGQKYTVLDTTANVRIIHIGVRVQWTGQPTPLEIHITIDGRSITHTKANPVSNTWYEATIYPQDDTTSYRLDPAGDGRYRAFQYEGRAVKVEAETTGGTVTNLYARVIYAKR